MAEYIKREDAEQEIGRFIGYIDEDMIARLKIAIRRIPAANARENVRGEWVPYNALVTDMLCCSECEFSVLPEETEVYRFCPNCGAYMRG